MKKLFLLIMILMFTVNVNAGQWDKDIPADGDAKIDYPTDAQANNDSIDRLISNYREGLKLTYTSGSTVTSATGEIVVSNAAGTVRLFLNNTSTTAITFADLDTSTEQAATTYYVYAVAALVTSETATFKISASSSLPTGETYYKRIGSFYNNGSSNIEQVANDNENSIVSTGTIAHGATISVPSGYSSDECDWTVSSSAIDVTYAIGSISVSANSSRVVTCQFGDDNWVDGGSHTTDNGTCNYQISCYR